MEEIFKRRSVRRFVDKEVSQDMVKKVLAAGMAAPSAGNQQPWQFIVVRDKERRKMVSQCGPHAGCAALAPVNIVVCGDLSLEKHVGYWVQDCSAAVENILLEVVSLGLGAVWLGVYPREERVKYLQKYLTLPDNIVPLAVIALGFPGQQLPPADRYNEARIHYELW